jgi:peptide deformylase
VSRREILRWPDPRLKAPCAPVGDPSDVTALITDLFETMYAAPGRGLAAPQVGVSLRLFVMDAGWKDGEMTPLACLNPQIVPLDAPVETGTEACLSVPGVTAEVTRPAAIRLRFTDLTGTAQSLDLSGAAARIAQHETDHLDGILHFDRLEADARAALLTAYGSAA